MDVEISPAITTNPVVTSVSHATRPVLSSERTASRTASEIWSAILSGWPSVTDSELKEKERWPMKGRRLAAGDGEERLEPDGFTIRAALRDERVERLQVPAPLGGQPLAGQPGQALEEGHGLVQVGVPQPAGAVAEADALHRLLEALVIDQLGAVAAEVPDRRRGGRDEQHAVERRPDDANLVDRHGVGGHAVHLERPHLAAEPAREPIDDAHRPRRIWSLHGERDLGDDEAGP